MRSPLLNGYEREKPWKPNLRRPSASEWKKQSAKSIGRCAVGLGRLVERLLREERVGAAQVGLEVGGRLVGHLDRRLQDALGHRLLRGQRRRLRGEEAAEVVVARLGGDLERALELGQPRLHQVDVLQEDPAALPAYLTSASSAFFSWPWPIEIDL